MGTKLGFLAGFAAGYVLGARAGEERYEQIKLQAGKAWQHPAVQAKVDDATTTIKERGPEVAAAAGQAALKGAGTAAKSAVSAGYQAATSVKKGPVVPGQLAEGEESGGTLTSKDVEGTAPSADTDSGDTKENQPGSI